MITFATDSPNSTERIQIASSKSFFRYEYCWSRSDLKDPRYVGNSLSAPNEMAAMAAIVGSIFRVGAALNANDSYLGWIALTASNAAMCMIARLREARQGEAVEVWMAAMIRGLHCKTNSLCVGSD